LSRRPPRLHHRRQLLPHSCTHRLAPGGLLGDGRTLLGFAFLLCPPGFLCSSDSGTCCRAHAATLLDTRWLSLAPLRRTTTPCGLGTQSHKSCNCVLDTTSFLPKLCHYALNVHVFPFFDCDTSSSSSSGNDITALSVAVFHKPRSVSLATSRISGLRNRREYRFQFG